MSIANREYYHQQLWWWIHAVVYPASLVLWLSTAAVISSGAFAYSEYWQGVLSHALSPSSFWLLVMLVSWVALSRDVFWKGYICENVE